MNTLVTSAGGPAAENAIRSFKQDSTFQIVGTDIYADLLKLSSADFVSTVHQAGEATDMFVSDINKLAKKYNCSFFLPISDKEIWVSNLNRSRLPATSLPSLAFTATCRDKSLLYRFMQDNNLPTPYTIYHVDFTTEIDRLMWMRATIGAGGYLAQEVKTSEDVRSVLLLSRNKHRDFIISEFLSGRNYCWTGLYRHGHLCFSVTKERLAWVYDRIGTTAVQKTVQQPEVNKICEQTVCCLKDSFDEDLTGLVMIDLKEGEREIFITEINAGRTGTVSFWFTLMSQLVYGDNRVNFHIQLHNIHHEQKMLPCMGNDALPPNVTFIRHIDMGSLLSYQGHDIRLRGI